MHFRSAVTGAVRARARVQKKPAAQDPKVPAKQTHTHLTHGVLWIGSPHPPAGVVCGSLAQALIG